MTARMAPASLSLVALAALAALGAPTVAHAQTLTAQLLSVGGDTTVTTTSRFGVADCTSDAVIRITGGPATLTGVWDFWEGVACNDAANRTSGTGTAPCTHGHSEVISTGTDQSITLPLIELFPVLAGACSGSDSNPIWILAAPAAGSTATVDYYTSLSVIIDFAAPGAPSGLGNASGDPPTLTWTAPSGATDVDHYCVYVDSTVTAATCGVSSTFGGDGGTATCTSTGSAASTYELSGLAASGQASVAVAAVDTAGNVGSISNLACAQRLPTEGFCDRYGGCPSNCAVAAPGTSRGATGALGAVLALAVLVTIRRRTR